MILLTGASGYLGFNIYNFFKKKKIKIYNSSRKKNKFTDLTIDFENFEIDEKLFDSLNIKVIIHSVSLNQQKTKIFPDLAKKISIEGTEKLLKFAKNKGVEKIIYFSTAQVYGKNLVGSVSEKTIPIPNNQYAQTHLGVEKICNKYSKYFKNGITILRLTNIIGSPNRKNKKYWNLVCNDFCLQAIKKNKIIINSSGLQVIDFLSIKSLTKVIENIISKKNFKNKLYIFNVGSGKSISVLKLAKIIKMRVKFIFKKNITIVSKKNNDKILNYSYENKKLNKSKINFFYNYLIKDIDETLTYCNSLKIND